MSATARLAGTQDAAAVAELLVAFRDHFGMDFPPDEVFHRGVRHLLDDPETDYVLGYADPTGDACGVVQLRFRYGIWRAGYDCLVEDVFVRDRARGHGVGRAMLAAAVARARERGARRMELDVNEENPAAIALYESFGFRASSVGSTARDLYMRVHLDP
ncbi:GNAT family N-acetyltransferase [Conexibacter sp. W3-3-2]|uniref:GNAT family N-acetyltransferase n=1 Tax=Conexibacter sp. W3-3-2 TaxID=2675227 RepID=UPI0012B7CDB4|nr:GNAT family N-acetyltransferase [Conexibacter sp. W3-3-2]MTD46134.1 GNAT family N-acetyltransferase [Conexibacter sp. W3-3-2]